MADNEIGGEFIITDDNKKTKLIYGIKKHSPQISILIPTYKRIDMLRMAIKSALNQIGGYNYEIIIVDNNPDKDFNLEYLLKEFDETDICYYKNEQNLGMVNNWNRCIELANSDWICLLHDDDLLDERYVENILSVISQNSEIGVIGVNNRKLDERNIGCTEESGKRKFKKLASNLKPIRKIINRILDGKYYKITALDCFLGNPFMISGATINKEVALKIGGFKESYYPTADYYFIFDVIEQNKVIFLNKKLLTYRLSCNESMKYETLERFVINDYYLREKIIETKITMGAFKIILKNFNKIYVIRNSYEIERNWGIKLNIDSIMKQLDIKKYCKRGESIYTEIIRKILRTIKLAKNFFNAKEL